MRLSITARTFALVPLAAIAAAAALACDVPRDSGGTEARVRGRTMRVGVIEHAPWVTDSAGVVAGVEPVLVERLARVVGARVEWVRAPAAQLLQALHDRELDLVIGGLTADLPWRSEVAFTRPFYTDTVVVGVRPGTRAEPLDGRAVAVENGDPIAAELRKRGARPSPVSHLADAPDAIAAPTWRLPGLGRVDGGVELRQAKHVMAVAPGENAWLVRVERTLRASEAGVPAMLRSAAP